MLRGALWFFLREQGEDIRKWDGEPPLKLEARVRDLRGKTAVEKGPPKKAVGLVAVETQEGNQRSPRHRRTEITTLTESISHGNGGTFWVRICREWKP